MSTRWIEGYERVAELAVTMPGTRLVYVADRESDILDLMVKAHETGCPADWLLRSQHNRVLPEGGKLWDEVLSGEPLGEIRFTLAARQGQKARQVRQQVWARRVEVPGTADSVITVTCIVAREVGAPADVKPLEWRLLSNRETDDLQAAAQLIDWYRARWEVEMFFHVLKNEVVRLVAMLGGFLARTHIDRQPHAKGLLDATEQFRARQAVEPQVALEIRVHPDRSARTRCSKTSIRMRLIRWRGIRSTTARHRYR